MRDNNQSNTINIQTETNGNQSNIFDYITQDGFFVSKYLNSSKNKIIFKVNFPEAKKFYFSKEFTYEEIIKICPLFSIEDNVEDIDQVITESINNYGVKTCNDEYNQNKINLIIKIKINSKIKEFIFQLDKTDYSQEEFLSSLVGKLNNLIEERKKVYGVKSFNDVQNDLFTKKDKLNTKLEELDKKLDQIGQRFNKIEENNLLVNSHIISDSEEIKLLVDYIKILEENERKKMASEGNIPQNDEIFLFKLVYRASRDGDTSKEFHKRCDNIGPNLTLVMTDKDIKFGGFTYCNWEVPNKDIKMNDEQGVQKPDNDSFCFSLNLKKIYAHNNDKNGAIFCCNRYGPTFCENIFSINNEMLSKGGYCTRNETSCFSGQMEDYEISGGEKNFNIKELEVFELIFI